MHRKCIVAHERLQGNRTPEVISQFIAVVGTLMAFWDCPGTPMAQAYPGAARFFRSMHQNGDIIVILGVTIASWVEGRSNLYLHWKSKSTIKEKVNFTKDHFLSNFNHPNLGLLESQSTNPNHHYLAILCWWPFWDAENVTRTVPELKGCWWPPTIGDKKVTAWITWILMVQKSRYSWLTIRDSHLGVCLESQITKPKPLEHPLGLLMAFHWPKSSSFSLWTFTRNMPCIWSRRMCLHWLPIMSGVSEGESCGVWYVGPINSVTWISYP